ncbi:alpha/beta hydrolase [Ectopseudomonas hydrolytica]|jgi:alpha-beta hydrolase superfamily lysophospholipase|uniref:alpha/beta hydrolase n=1 Tax=Ectopseudomonas hydrolytica TaxID=2493633 RepID=UPI0020B79E35|nr:alpha/beta hydrolase [Pseudomonas hydrolytica]UTH30237.1 alpha/beta hydrolase [Pseudomonas hydrolytica]
MRLPRMRNVMAWTLVLLLLIAVALLGVRIAGLSSLPDLQPWHRLVPQELEADELDQADWQAYLAAEAAIHQRLQRELIEPVTAAGVAPFSRYSSDSPVYPGKLSQDWNRSFILPPAGAPRGVVVLLHGLTDSPYSLRHIASHLSEQGLLAVVPRMPGHGTVPGALTAARWEQWLAATRLAVREARRQVPDGPLYLIGYSNGGALALRYSLAALEDERLAMPQRLVLISPMVGVTRYARYAGLAALPAVLPAFAKSAWMNVLPEFNPFKYNSFPVHAARQTYELTHEVQRAFDAAEADGRLQRLPPVLAFQSLADSTVSTPAVVRDLFERLPANGSELVVFDINRSQAVSSLLRADMSSLLEQLLPPAERDYDLTVVGVAPERGRAVEARRTAAGSLRAISQPLGVDYPSQLFSLSHVALPFPPSDPLYGSDPAPGEDYGVALGTLAPRGEHGVLVVGLGSLQRVTSNPFYAYLRERIDEDL